MPAEPLLALSGVTKAFGGLTVVQDVGFDLPRGGRLGLIGPNGAGKTTVFNLISGVYPIDAGEIRLDGQPISRLPPRARVRAGIARSFQNIRLMPHLSAVENVMLGQHARAAGLGALLTPIAWMPRGRWRREAEELLAAAGLDIDPGEVVANLPYGIRKKIEVVRALAARPKLLMLDEPAAGLNPAETAELARFLREIAAAGTTLLVVEHDMGFVNEVCDRVVVLNFGRKIFEGSMAGARADTTVREAYLGAEAADAA
ncbi:ABC transporter ATP-binding protein [Falsiroseomonas bella]|uniref:ABC transporter ATP-binding protein n=1 Tax=Falsiroseomonas bella TaxID=2184016 RepID=A0A317FES3_9PROT|nr:ABC transporter ATP-binding protein [Falsiroseomonas bella]PWS36098.1 ABC transporter ATP-binding protein [Falsiroseomonas bella]